MRVSSWFGIFCLIWHMGSVSGAMTESKPVTEQMVAGVIDHTFLKTEKEGVSLQEQEKEVLALVDEAVRYGAYSVCVREHMVKVARRALEKKKSGVKIVSVIGFPVGDDFTPEQKVKLLKQARKDGANEFDMVINVKALKRGENTAVYDDIVEVSKAAGTDVLKLIFENAYLEKSQKQAAYKMARKAFLESFAGDSSKLKYRFFKTSTGFAKPAAGVPVGATLEDVEHMHKVGEGLVGIKPAGGVSSFEDAKAYFKAVGSPLDGQRNMDPMKFRIGTSSLLSKLFGESTKGGY